LGYTEKLDQDSFKAKKFHIYTKIAKSLNIGIFK